MDVWLYYNKLICIFQEGFVTFYKITILMFTLCGILYIEQVENAELIWFSVDFYLDICPAVHYNFLQGGSCREKENFLCVLPF